MARAIFSLTLSSLLAGVLSANCIQTRAEGEPTTGKVLAGIIRHNDFVRIVCEKPRWSNDGLTATNPFRRPFTFKVTRSGPAANLTHCIEGFNEIINQCIWQANSWGGTWSSDAVKYEIWNPEKPGAPIPDVTPTISRASGTVNLTPVIIPDPTGTPLTQTTGAPRTVTLSAVVIPDTTGTPLTQTSRAPANITLTPVIIPDPSGTPSGNITSPPVIIPGPTMVTLTQTTNGHTLAAIFVPTTIAQYATLSTPTTITTTGTRVNGDPVGIPLVIWAGGIAWWIFNGIWPVGPLPTPPLFPPPLLPVDGEGGETGPPNPTSAEPEPTSKESAKASSVLVGYVKGYSVYEKYPIDEAARNALVPLIEEFVEYEGPETLRIVSNGTEPNCVSTNGELAIRKPEGCCKDKNFKECPKSKVCAWIPQTHGGGDPCEPYDGYSPPPPPKPCDTKPSCDVCGGADSNGNCLTDLFISYNNKKYKGCPCVDNQYCPRPKPMCSTCHGGEEGFCAYGQHVNCPCDNGTPTVTPTTPTVTPTTPTFTPTYVWDGPTATPVSDQYVACYEGARTDPGDAIDQFCTSDYTPSQSSGYVYAYNGFRFHAYYDGGPGCNPVSYIGPINQIPDRCKQWLGGLSGCAVDGKTAGGRVTVSTKSWGCLTLRMEPHSG